ncbi:nonsense-mediated mRNA decay factor SMG9-like [Impatiens glandulifera]|uniref:nonsense-mediated mRNA decay factor SMG9-like n=1 Tax=Impatiens glandulifera TaxID=253017 RepID=UPI001FB0D2F1|nr:nonsense-mediated mRNA decay factor SMG9-like [Impatiens glandulifera]
MAGTGVSGSSSSYNAAAAPKILLAKPTLANAGKFMRGGGSEEESSSSSSASLRSRLHSVGSLNLLSDSWDFQIDRFLPFLTDNTDFTVVGVIGAAGVGKSTIMNELYGFDGTSPGMLPPFQLQTDEIRAIAKHCSTGIEPRVSAERIILLDTQPVFSPSLLSEIIRPDGSSTISVLSGEVLSAELAHELMNIQLGVLLASICHIVLVVSDSVHDLNMWHLMLTVDLLKHGIPDPSSPTLTHSNLGAEKENKDKLHDAGEEYIASPIFVHTRLHGEDLTLHNIRKMKKALAKCFSSSSFNIDKNQMTSRSSQSPSTCPNAQSKNEDIPKLFLIPLKNKDDSTIALHDSFVLILQKLRDQVLSSMDSSLFGRTVSERDWLRNSAKIWELVKNSPIIAEYARGLQNSGMFKR